MNQWRNAQERESLHECEKNAFFSKSPCRSPLRWREWIHREDATAFSSSHRLLANFLFGQSAGSFPADRNGGDGWDSLKCLNWIQTGRHGSSSFLIPQVQPSVAVQARQTKPRIDSSPHPLQTTLEPERKQSDPSADEDAALPEGKGQEPFPPHEHQAEPTEPEHQRRHWEALDSRKLLPTQSG